MVRDLEIQRLVNYIKGIGLKITFSSKKSDCSAEWYLDNSGIIIYRAKNTTKIETVLSLIHELGHALHNIDEKERKTDVKFDAALDHLEKAEELGIDTKKRQRKIIFDNEVCGTEYWDDIYKMTDMRFPLWRLEFAKEYDIWQYEVFYETGKDPSGSERAKKRKELNKKYRKNYE